MAAEAAFIVADLLLNSGVDPNKLSAGKTPLIHVMESGADATFLQAQKICVRLLEGGAQPNLPDNEGATALVALFRNLLPGGSSSGCMTDALAPVLVEAGGEITTRDRKGYTALRYAVEARDYNAVTLLASLGATE